MDFLPYLVLIELIVLLLMVFMRLFSISIPGTGRTQSPVTGPRLMPYLYLEQLDPDTMEPYKRFPMDESRLEEYGFAVSGSQCETGDIRLSGKFEQAQMVGSEHIVIWKDDKGCFAVDNGSMNGTRLPNQEERLKQIAITNGMVLYLGPQPVRFVFVRQDGKDIPRRRKQAQKSSRAAGQPGNSPAADGDTRLYTGNGPHIPHKKEQDSEPAPLDDHVHFRTRPVRRHLPNE